MLFKEMLEANENLEILPNVLMEWFSSNKMKANPDRFYLIGSSHGELTRSLPKGFQKQTLLCI